MIQRDITFCRSLEERHPWPKRNQSKGCPMGASCGQLWDSSRDPYIVYVW